MAAEGVKWISNATSGTLARYHGAAGSNTRYEPATRAVATTYFDTLVPWGGMGRVSMRPDGSVASRCNVNATAFQSGDNCYSDTDGTGGENKMVYVPQFCLACDRLTTNQVWWWIGQVGDKFRKSDNSGDYTFTASDIHPAFLADGVAQNGAFISAYEGYYDGTKLRSLAVGVPPTAAQTINTFRTQAQANGSGWQMSTIQLLAAMQAMFIIEYGSLNSQWLGVGVVSGSVANIGATATNGNASSGTYTDTTTPVSYRGIENLWGNVSTYIEGFKLQSSDIPWIAPQTPSATYVDATFVAPYTNPTSGGYMATSTGYIVSVLETVPWGFIPASTVGGVSGQYFCSAFIEYSGNVSTVFGGSYSDSTNGGIFFIKETPAANSDVTRGARLQYIPS